jgi:hypothetical protein
MRIYLKQFFSTQFLWVFYAVQELSFLLARHFSIPLRKKSWEDKPAMALSHVPIVNCGWGPLTHVLLDNPVYAKLSTTGEQLFNPFNLNSNTFYQSTINTNFNDDDEKTKPFGGALECTLQVRNSCSAT